MSYPETAPPRSAIASGLLAYLIWGLMPLYFKLLSAVRPGEMLSQRITWSAVLLLALVAAKGELAELITNLRTRKVLLSMALSALFIGANWFIFVLAVTHGHMLAASLGYFLNPIVNVLIGVLVLRERLRPVQTAAVLLASVGVVMMALAALDTVWISLALALTFAFYGLVRKLAPIGPVQGQTVETVLMLPFALCWIGYLALTGAAKFGVLPQETWMLALLGLFSTLPLVLFSSAARALPLSTLALLQYVSPTLQFLDGWAITGEPLSRDKLIAFAVIWLALGIFTWDLLRASRKRAAAAAP